MASASSLLGLVNQLQNMELSFTSILMEAAIKLSKLTDANVFMLVETQEGRRFSGKRHLCDAYIRGELTPIGNDVEFEVNPAISALQQKPYQSKGTHPNGISTLNNECYWPNLNQSAHCGPGAADRSVIPSSSVTPTSLKRHSSDSLPSSQLHVKQLKLSDSVDVKCEVRGEAVQFSDNDSDIAEIVDETDDYGFYKKQTTSEEKHDSLIDISSEDYVPGADVLDYVTSCLSAKKIEAMKCLSGEAACMRGAVENKLSTSLCYDFGKALADARPRHMDDVASKQFFSKTFENWISQFVNLVEYFQSSIPNGRPEGGQTFTFLGLLRQSARSGFTQRLIKYKNRH